MGMLVSIIVPSYNVGAYLGECISSILAQTYEQWEVLIVNDGSTDNTAEIAAALARTDPRIRLINQENGGVSVARNTGLRAAKGQCVAFLDGDDLWEPEFLAETVGVKMRTNADAVYSGYSRFYSNGYKRKYRYHYPGGSLIIPPADKPVRFHIGAMLFDKALLDKHAITFTPGGLVGQDWEMIAKVLTVATVQPVPRDLMIYRQRKGSTLNSRWNWKRHIHALHGYKRAIDFMAQKLAGASNLEEVLRYHNAKLGRQSCRLLWRMIKTGSHQDVLDLMADAEFAKRLECVPFKTLRLPEALKYKIVLSKNRLCWNILKLLGH
ncbi:MAG: waaV [Firmicutes bacterium]|nr:waaV [Bacillota bacterium]